MRESQCTSRVRWGREITLCISRVVMHAPVHHRGCFSHLNTCYCGVFTCTEVHALYLTPCNPHMSCISQGLSRSLSHAHARAHTLVGLSMWGQEPSHLPLVAAHHTIVQQPCPVRPRLHTQSWGTRPPTSGLTPLGVCAPCTQTTSYGQRMATHTHTRARSEILGAAPAQHDASTLRGHMP